MHLLGSKDSKGRIKEEKTHADVSNDVLRLGSSRKLVDVLNCLAYERKEFEGRKKGMERKKRAWIIVRQKLS